MSQLSQVLISNDDALDSPFLKPFLRAFSKISKSLICVVPATEQSWIGRAYSRHKNLTLTQHEGFDNVQIFTIDGTPADCVNIALSHIVKGEIDAVVSGMNIGQNLALPLLWSSGTFAAAAEGAAFGKPAFACSMQLAKEHYEICRLKHLPPPKAVEKCLACACEHSANFVLKNLEDAKKNLHSVYNLNYPSDYSSASPFKICEPAKVEIKPLYEKAADGSFHFKYAIGDDLSDANMLTDMKCIKNSWGSCSVVKIIS